MVDGQSVYIGGSTLAVPAGSTQATYSFRHTFTGIGNKSFLVKIYNQGKTDLLNSREFLNILEIHGSRSVSYINGYNEEGRPMGGLLIN